MGVAIAPSDAGDDIAIERVALVRPVDGDPESLPALLADNAGVVGHDPTRLFRQMPASICDGTTVDCKRDLALALRRCGLPDPAFVAGEGRTADRRHHVGSRQ